MEATLSQVLITMTRMMRDYQQTIDGLVAEVAARDQRIADLEAGQRSGNGIASSSPQQPQEVPSA
jgi:hypothetical protein